MCFFLSRYIHYWIKPSGKTTKQTPLAFIFLYILMSPNPNISHWEGSVCKPRLSPSLMMIFRLNPLVLGADTFQSILWSPRIKAYLAASKRELLQGVSVELDSSYYLTAPKWKTTVWQCYCIVFWVGGRVFMQVSWPLGSDLGKQSRCWQWLAAGTAGC